MLSLRSLLFSFGKKCRLKIMEGKRCSCFLSFQTFQFLMTNMEYTHKVTYVIKHFKISLFGILKKLDEQYTNSDMLACHCAVHVQVMMFLDPWLCTLHPASKEGEGKISCLMFFYPRKKPFKIFSLIHPHEPNQQQQSLT